MRTPMPQTIQRWRYLTVAVTLFTIPWIAASAPAEGLPTFAEIVDVRVVNLEVVVTDGGKRVSGLEATDFELEIDGETVPIDFFTEVRQGVAVEPTGASDRVTSMPALVPGERVGTRYLVFIDNFFTIPSHRDRVLRALRGQLDRLASGDSMAVVAYNGRRVDLLTSWTRSPAELTEALDRAMERPAYGLRRMSEMRRLGLPLAPGTDGTYSARSSFSSIGFLGSGRASPPELRPGYEIDARIAQVVCAAAAAMRGFAQPPEGQLAGRKVMLVLSGGWPAFPTRWAERLAGAGRVGDPQVVSARERFRVFEPLVHTANRLGYTLYPVNLQPVTGIRSSSARLSFPSSAQIFSARQQVQSIEANDALYALAEATGGRAFESAASRQVLGKAVEDTRSYYWLGFSPEWRGDDESHRVKVRLRQRGLRVRSRDGFTDLSRRSEVDLMLEGAQLFDQPLPGDGALKVVLGEPQRSGRGRLRVPLTVTIPLDRVTLLPTEKGYSATLELRVAARDEDGLVAEIPLVPVQIDRATTPVAGDTEVREIQLRLRQKSHRLIVALYEPATGNILSQRLDLEL